MSSEVAIGIDLGTCFTKAGIFKDKRKGLQVIETSSKREILNYVAFKANDRELGENLKTKIRMNYNKLAFDSKLFIGSTYNNNSNSKRYPFQVAEDENGKAKFRIDPNFQVYPEEVTGIILQKVKESSEKLLKTEVKDVVISVPTCFNDSQRQATIDAAHLAGLNVLSLINDTTAAAIAYAYDKDMDEKKCILTFDLGAYHLNLGIFTIENEEIQIKSAESYPGVGGQEFDLQMVSHIYSLLDKSKTKLNSNKAFQTLLVECEKAKKNLSNGLESFIEIISFFEENDEDFNFNFTRNLFENLNKLLFSQVIKHVKNLLDSAKLNPSEIDEVILIGGSSRIPKIQEMLSSLFNGKVLNKTMNASESIVCGASIKAAALTNSKLKLNNSFKNLNSNSIDYCLKINSKNDEELLELSIEPNTILPLNKNITIKNVTIKEKSPFLLKLLENNQMVLRTEIACSHFNDSKQANAVSQMEIILSINTNGNCSITTKYSDRNQRFQCTSDHFSHKKYCLDQNKLKSIKEANEVFGLDQKELNERLVIKNQIETKLYDFKKEMSKIETNAFQNNAYSELNNDLEDLINEVQSNKIENVIEVDLKLEKLKKKAKSIQNRYIAPSFYFGRGYLKKTESITMDTDDNNNEDAVTKIQNDYNSLRSDLEKYSNYSFYTDFKSDLAKCESKTSSVEKLKSINSIRKALDIEKKKIQKDEKIYDWLMSN